MVGKQLLQVQVLFRFMMQRHALTIAEIKQIQQDLAAAAKRAVEAGFD